MEDHYIDNDHTQPAFMYYRLKEPYSFRGWKKLPYAIRAEHGEDMRTMPVFFGREEFHYLMYLNGEEAVDPDSLPENVRGIIDRLTEKCTGGCLVQGITEDGDFLRPDPKLCWFFRNKGAGAVKEVADAAISRIKQ